MYSVWQGLSWLFFLILALFKKQFKKAIELNEGNQKEPSLLILELNDGNQKEPSLLIF